MENSYIIKTDYKFLTLFIYIVGGIYLYSFMDKIDYLLLDKHPDQSLYFWASLGILLLSIHLGLYYFGRIVLYSKSGINFVKYKDQPSLKGILFFVFAILVFSQIVYSEEVNLPVMLLEVGGVILYTLEVYKIHFQRRD